MYQYLGILGTDTINRDGYLITFEALHQSIADNAVNGMPSLIDHDFHRPAGWIFPFGIMIEPKISKTIGNFNICENEEDKSLVYPKIQEHRKYIDYKNCQDYFDEVKSLLKDNYSSDGKFMQKGCVAYRLPDIVKKVFPKLFDNLDKSELIYLDDILKEFDYVGSGIFKSKNTEFCIFCHQYFNRSLSRVNNFNTYFIDEFIQLNSKENITLRLAIDTDLIGLSKTHTGVLEFDYWWGPKFNDDISNLPNEVTRYECNDEQKFFSCVSGTEFWWKTDESGRTLEIEEIRERPSMGIDSDSYGCRYIHSIYDTDKKEFNHFDGAVRVYTEEQILNRWDININKAGKNTNYTKLFRIDGKLDLSDWKKLCILYYKGNPLLFEYFGAKEEYENERPKALVRSELDRCLPNKITSEDGIRLFVSYHHKTEEYTSFERKTINPDIWRFENGDSITTLEYDVLEIGKHLKRNGEKIDYPEEINFVKPYDFYTNYPIILHGSDDTESHIQKTLQAFKTIFEIQNKNLNKTISLTLAWEMDNFEARLSVFGKSSEIVKWLNTFEQIPAKHEEFNAWIVEQRKWIYDTYEYSERDFSHLLKKDGVFYIKRTPINSEMITFPNDNDPEYYEIQTKGNKQLKALIEENVIQPSYATLLTDVICTKSEENYITSSTSKYLDEDVTMGIKGMDLLGFFWTDEV